jgi:chromosome segregation ATPase
MRDYTVFAGNNMPFRKPQQQQQAATPAGTNHNNNNNTNSTAGTTSSQTSNGSSAAMMMSPSTTTTTSVPSSPTQSKNHRHHQQHQQYQQPQHQNNNGGGGGTNNHHHFHHNHYPKTPIANNTQTTTTPNTTGTTVETATTSTVATNVSLSPSDALALRRDGPELVISKLRQQLAMAEEMGQSSRSNAAKAEAVIVELKGTIRQLKRNTTALPPPTNNNANNNNSNAAVVGDMQTQLDQAHAQLLTADMVRKELEDTLEAEQYTWDLREQEQERTIQSLQQQLDELRSSHELEMKLVTEERAELQACLDEALKELEAVDAELQNNRDLESLQSLHDFVTATFRLAPLPLEDYSTIPSLSGAMRDMLLLVSGRLEQQQQQQIQHPSRSMSEMDATSANNNSHGSSASADAVKALRQELAVREASSTELRNSLKEAVALLKPLQDAVGKGDRERSRLQDQVRLWQVKEMSLQKSLRDVKDRLRSIEDENGLLRDKAESLEVQLSRAKLEAASSVMSHAHSVATAESAASRIRAKRQSEQTLKQMLADAQTKFSVLQHEKEAYSAHNSILQRQMNDESIDIGKFEMEIETLRADIERLQREILEKDSEINELRESIDHSVNRERLGQLEHEVEEKTKSLAAKRENERILNKSLKDALSLIKPLQMHLEEAENEKMVLANQLEALQSEHGIAATIRQLEQENAALQDALEQMSQSIHGGGTIGTSGGGSHQSSDQQQQRLAQELVQLQSRYAVTQKRLQDASMQNDDLLEQLHDRDRQDHELFQELSELRERASTTAPLKPDHQQQRRQPPQHRGLQNGITNIKTTNSIGTSIGGS